MFIRTIAVLALATSAAAFQPVTGGRGFTGLRAATMDAPYFVTVEEPKAIEAVTPQENLTPSPPARKPLAMKKAPKKAAAGHKEGIFSPTVLFMKGVMGDATLNKVRGKAISLHSEVIATFVDTSDSVFGDAVLRSLFKLADKDGNGTICKDELQIALHSLGFSWLQEKQVNGIFSRADADGNGAIDLEEWIKEAPKTLRTNLTKLAKKNGGELGFLV